MLPFNYDSWRCDIWRYEEAYQEAQEEKFERRIRDCEVYFEIHNYEQKDIEYLENLLVNAHTFDDLDFFEEEAIRLA